MQGANSQVAYFPQYVIKTVIDDEEYEQPLLVAAAREVYLMQLAKTGYTGVPEPYSLSGTSITMQRVQGVRLGDYMRSHGSVEVYRRLATKVKAISRRLLAAGVVHRDLTFENILVGAEEYLWVVDFGRARLVLPGEDVKVLHEDEMFIYFDTLNDVLRSELDDIIPDEYSRY